MGVADDIITVTDVKNEGAITSSTLNKNINYRIPWSIENVIYDELGLTTDTEIQEILDDTKKNNNLRWAIIYDVLAWLESKSLISGSDKIITSIKDSQASISYGKAGASPEGTPSTYKELSKKYINKLLFPTAPTRGVPILCR